MSTCRKVGRSGASRQLSVVNTDRNLKTSLMLQGLIRMLRSLSYAHLICAFLHSASRRDNLTLGSWERTGISRVKLK